MRRKYKTKSQIKIERFILCGVGMFSLLGIGYNLATQNWFNLLLFTLGLILFGRVDKLNNDLEYGRYSS